MIEGIRARTRAMLPRGELTRGVLVLVLGTVVGQVVLILSSPILTRLYAPADFGALSVATSIVSVLLTITCLSYELAIPLPEDDVDASSVLALTLLVNLVMSLAAGMVLFLAGPPILGFLGAVVLGPFAVLLAVDQLGGGVGLGFNGWAIRTKAFTVIAAASVAQSAALVSVQIGLGLFSSGAFGLVVASVAGRLAQSASLAWAAWRTHAASFRRVTRASIAHAAHRYRRFPLLSSGSALLNTLGLQMPILMIIAIYGASVGGELFLAQRVAAIPITFFARSVGQVYTSEAARLMREEPPGIRALFLRTTGRIARLGVVPSALVGVAAPFLFGPVFGDDWREAGIYTAILAPMYFLTLVASPTSGTLDVLERQDLHLVREILRIVIVGGAVLAAAALHLPAVGGIALLSAAGCLMYCIYALISWRAIVSHGAQLRAALGTER